jgi:hypothetical protein
MHFYKVSTSKVASNSEDLSAFATDFYYIESDLPLALLYWQAYWQVVENERHHPAR